eukprot:Gregarina_sp_Pseudo_9__1578@NODE_205_length_3618_cov_206_722269_g190_i0_p2_GENE_NODE_205_length_3618_cov_206_722269_g190_i0NODE_205_length_3618_cov_206_722269_g190_i0_p2_ORF_typecomplete_len454_score74_46Mg_trans_NIPA/PF05653_14/1_3e27Nuc_sug_transp/PF04142_15/4_3e05PUNUT/PF16913_5/5_2e05TMEM234/PF10639_9/0_00066EamA/PF00892_20/0_0005EamA/PF00892_20/6_9e03EamA/PF00892_20/2_3e02CRTlike/PF08627_10/0_0047Tetraspanin/PF00335_20/80Tetraspanin/PF00335_20/0_0052TPT/PF03151_16/0_3TPT/PF03151_16/1_6e03TP
MDWGGWFWTPKPELPVAPSPEWSPLSLLGGIVFTVVGAFIISIGSLLDASEHRHGQHARHFTFKSGVPYEMIVGILLVLLGNALHVAGLWLAPASLLAPTNAVGLVSTHFLAKIMFNDPVTASAWVSTIGITIGIIMCGVSSASAGTVGLSPEQRHIMYLSTWSDRPYQVFVTILMLLIVGIYTFLLELEFRQSAEDFLTFRNAPHFSAYERVPNEVQEQAAGRDAENATHTRVLGQTHGNLLAILAGIVGSQTVCEIKELESVFHQVARYGFKGLLNFKASLLSIPLLVVCGLGQWPYLNMAYRVGSPQLVSACYYVSWTVLGSVGGFVKFKEHHGMSFNEKLFYGIGLSINLASILIACSKSIQDLMRFYLYPDCARHESPEQLIEMQSMRAKVLANFMAAPFMDRVLPNLSYLPNPLEFYSAERATTVELVRTNERTAPARAVYSSNISF